MRALLQRVTEASVTVDKKIVGEIEVGILALIGFGSEDEGRDDTLPKLRDKILTLRIFPDDKGKFDKSVTDINGGVLLVPQFTLYGTCDKGRRPDFNKALAPDSAKEMFHRLLDLFREDHPKSEAGIFGADMKVRLLNDGPVTLSIEM